MSGWIATGVSIVCFGSNFVPVKKFETGDGIFFQWVLCTAVWVVGCILNIARTNFDSTSNHLVASVEFYPFAMLGGALWCIGNATAVTIIKCIGLGLGMCLWGSINLLLGWASGNFGLFGLTAQPAPHPILNYVGVGLAVVGAGMFTLIETDTKTAPKSREDERYLLSDPYRVNETPGNTNESFIDKLPPAQKRILGISLAFIAGLFYGGNFNPPTYILDRNGAQGLDFVFSHFTGIFLTSTLIMAVYCAICKNQPVLYPQAVLPGMLSGLLWAIAQCSWFVANEKLSMTVSFPLISTGPGLVASLWGVLVFQEIRGTKNFIFLGLGFAIVGVAVTLIALSKQQ